MARDARIHVRVEEGRKERWEDSVGGESDHRDLTHLIVSAVEKELSSPSNRGDAVEVDGEVAVDLSPIHDRFDGVMEAVGEVKEEVEAVGRQVEHPGSSVQEFVASQILKNLPRHNDLQGILVGESAEDEPPETSLDEVQRLGTQEGILEWAEEQDWPRGIVYDALDEMEREGPVEMERHEGDVYYFVPSQRARDEGHV